MGFALADRLKNQMLATAALLLTAQALKAETPIYRDRKAPLEKRVEDLFNRTTPEERMDLLTGTGFTTRPIPRLGVPAIPMADAGQGVRGGMPSTEGPATAFPSGVAMASTWDPELIGRVGKAIGEEALNKGTGVQILLGPAVNIHRSPLGGRNGEYFSEDPYLASRLAVGYIQGMQSTGCAACVKHYAANNEELDRGYVDVKVDERTLREIYLPAFEASVREGKVWTVMSSYNKVNGYHSSANHYLLTDVLKKGWGFDGMVMSDWGGVHETVGVVNAGNDLEMPGPGLLRKETIARAVERGQITQTTVDENARRILRTVIRVGLLDGPKVPNHKLVDSPAHRKLTFEAASKGIVLLKNQGNVLPLDRQKLRSIAVIGSAAKNMEVGAAGSPTVTPFYAVQPLDGIRNAAAKGTTVRYARGDINGEAIPTTALTGVKAEYFKGRELQGTPVISRSENHIEVADGSPAPGVPATDYSARWTAKLTAPVSGTYTFTLTADDGCRLFVDGKPVIDQWHLGGETAYPGTIELEAGHTYDVRVEFFQGGGSSVLRFNWLKPEAIPYGEAIAAAKASDVAVVVVSTSGDEGEGQDRPSMFLPRNQDALIEAVAAVNKRTIVVLNNGTPVDMRRWIKSVPGLVETWFPGQEGGAALAAVLFGDVNPSGKLPDTLAARREQYPDFGNFPGVKGTVRYKEGIYVGYRHFDKQGIVPTFPFGYGLSYTQFKYGVPTLSAPTADGTRIASIGITNVGKRAGAEVVQLYVHDPKPKIDKAVRELKGFKKVMLAPGETKSLTFAVPPRALAYCDVAGKQWKADAGTYDLEFGSSSRDIRSRAKMVFAKTFTKAIPFMQEAQSAAILGSDLARNKVVSASSVEDRKDVGDLGPGSAVDGDDSTRWSSAREANPWISIDLLSTKSVGRIELHWEEAYASAYAIQTSLDGETWKDVYSTQDSVGGAESIPIKTTVTRYVRVYCLKRATDFGISLYNFAVYPPSRKK